MSFTINTSTSTVISLGKQTGFQATFQWFTRTLQYAKKWQKYFSFVTPKVEGDRRHMFVE